MDSYTEFSKLYDELMQNIPYEMWCEDIVSLLKKYGMETGTICELGCGTGIMTELLATKGYSMTGVDISPDMLALAKDKQDKSGSNVCYNMQDMCELTLFNPVDAMISLCDSMNYLLKTEELEAVFRRVKRYLKPGGIFIFDMKTEYCFEQVMGNRILSEQTENSDFYWDNCYDKEERLNEYQLTMYFREEGNELFRKYEEVHIQRAYEIQEVSEQIEKSGLTLIHIYGGRLLQNVTDDCERVYFVVKNGGKE